MKQNCQISTLSCSAQIALLQGTMTVQKKCKLCSGLLTQPFLCLRFNSFTLYSNQSCTDNDEDRPYTADSARQDTESEPNKYFEVWNLSELWEKSRSRQLRRSKSGHLDLHTMQWGAGERETFQPSNLHHLNQRVMSTLNKKNYRDISIYTLHTMQWGAGER